MSDYILGSQSVMRRKNLVVQKVLRTVFRIRLTISSFVHAYLFQQLIQNGWPFNQLLTTEEFVERNLTLGYIEKFNAQAIDSSIRPHHGGRSAAYSRQFEDQGLSAFPHAGLVELANVLVDMPTCMHRCQGKTLRFGLLDIICLTNPLYLSAFITLPWKRPSRLAGGVLLGLPFIKNYYHWMIEIMPRIQMIEAESQFDGLPWLLPADCPNFVRELINTAGYGDRVVYLDRHVYHFDRLIVPTVLSHGSGPNHPAEINWLRKTFLPLPLPPATRRLFVSRQDAQIRFITNEQEVFERLEPLGFEWITPGSLSFSEQVQRFAEAEIVVGSHGAGLANIVFSPATSGLVEIFGNNHFSNCYSQIAKLRNMTYGILAGEKDGLGIVVDPNELFETVGKVMTRVTAASANSALPSQG
jgi:hypothetical protein